MIQSCDCGHSHRHYHCQAVDYEFNEEAIAPVSTSNSIAGRIKNYSSPVRIINSRRIQTKHFTLSGPMTYVSIIEPGNYLSYDLILYPSGLHSNNNHFISLRKLNC